MTTTSDPLGIDVAATRRRRQRSRWPIPSSPRPNLVLVRHISATNGGAWSIDAIPAAGSCSIVVRNISTASITEATPLQFFVLKGATS